jgi:hypothetical protein
MSKKHYSERRHPKTHKGPAQPKGKMSRKAFRAWVRASLANPEFNDSLPRGYGARAYFRAAKIETKLVSIQLGKYNNKNRTHVRRPVER